MPVVLLLLVLTGCIHPVPPLPADFPEPARPDAEALAHTVEQVSGPQLNLGRQRRARKRAEAYGLDPHPEWIDVYTRQRNLVVELPGRRPEVVYLVAHHDKTDANWLQLVSLLLNGLLDEVVGFSFTSQGAVDNATGVAVVLELGRWLAGLESRELTWRILLAGSEEVGLRGTRAHLARLGKVERDRIALAINVDAVGARYSDNCVFDGASDPELVDWVLGVAEREGVALGRGVVPALATSDHAPFRASGPLRDIGRGLSFNLVGGLLPQRSWFTTSHRAPTLFLGGCELFDGGDLLSALLVVPTGRLHGPRDNRRQVDAARLYEAFAVLRRWIEEVEGAPERLIALDNPLVETEQHPAGLRGGADLDYPGADARSAPCDTSSPSSPSRPWEPPSLPRPSPPASRWSTTCAAPPTSPP